MKRVSGIRLQILSYMKLFRTYILKHDKDNIKYILI